jgi:hypothetical protein
VNKHGVLEPSFYSFLNSDQVIRSPYRNQTELTALAAECAMGMRFMSSSSAVIDYFCFSVFAVNLIPEHLESIMHLEKMSTCSPF